MAPPRSPLTHKEDIIVVVDDDNGFYLWSREAIIHVCMVDRFSGGNIQSNHAKGLPFSNKVKEITFPRSDESITSTSR